jgi:hypothetical protein
VREAILGCHIGVTRDTVGRDACRQFPSKAHHTRLTNREHFGPIHRPLAPALNATNIELDASTRDVQHDRGDATAPLDQGSNGKVAKRHDINVP